jgi:hypothetical protein
MITKKTYLIADKLRVSIYFDFLESKSNSIFQSQDQAPVLSNIISNNTKTLMKTRYLQGYEETKSVTDGPTVDNKFVQCINN